MTIARVQPWRWLVKSLQAVALLGIPFVRVGGESAFRFDVPTLTLHFFGAAVGMDEFFLVLVFLLFLSFLFLALTVLLGRIWCGWLCPQTVLVDLTRFVDRMPYRPLVWRVGVLSAVFAASIVIAADILWYFVSPYEFLSLAFQGGLGPLLGWSWVVLTVLTFLNIAFLRHRFCSTVCPYAKMQGALFDTRTLVISADDERMRECMHCDACVRTCPVGIDIRNGLNAACIACAECIDACARQMGRRQRRSLIGYRFGANAAGESTRRNAVLSTVLAAAFLALFVCLLVTRSTLDIDVAADPSSQPRSVADEVMNTYLLSITNRTSTAETLMVRVLQPEGEFAVQPSSVTIGAGEHRRIPITVGAGNGRDLKGSPVPITVVITSLQRPSLRLERKTLLLPPW